MACFNTLPWTAAALYGASQILDAVDGNVARALNQGKHIEFSFQPYRVYLASLFGAVLDQVTDRMSTVCIYTLIASRYPAWITVVLIFAIADLAGHWIYIHAQTVAGAKNHKDVPAWCQINLLNLYYKNKYVMFVCHAALESFLCGVLILGHLQRANTAFQGKIRANDLWYRCCM